LESPIFLRNAMSYKNFLETPIWRGDVLYSTGRELFEQLSAEIKAEREFRRQYGRVDDPPPEQREPYHQDGRKIKTGYVTKMLHLYLKTHPVKADQEEPASILLSSVKKRNDGYPWMITLDYERGKYPIFSLDQIGMFCFSMREREPNKLRVDLPNIPSEWPLECLLELEDAMRICRETGPEGSDWERVWLFDDEDKELIPKSEIGLTGEGFACLDAEALRIHFQRGQTRFTVTR